MCVFYIPGGEELMKVGDWVRCIDNNSFSKNLTVGKKYLIKKENTDYFYIVNDLGVMSGGYFKSRFIKEESMSLRDRINALENGWDKEADYILQEIGGEYFICISCKNNEGVIAIEIQNSKRNRIKTIETNGSSRSSADDSCEKMVLFKQALLWLLEESGKDAPQKGDTLKTEIEGKVYKVKVLEKL